MQNYQELWENRSSIRTRPRKEIDFNQNGLFFPPEKQLLLLLPEINTLGENAKNEILLLSLYKYLNDIVNLETKLIVEACNYIINDNSLVKYPQETKLNAYTIIIDEYYHVYIAQDMLNQLNSKFPTIPKLKLPDSDANEAVLYMKTKIQPQYVKVFEIIAVCIFETTVVRELVEFFKDPQVHPSIRHYVNDHMNDEAKHYNFFYDLLIYTWSSLPNDCKENLGTYLATFVKLYLRTESDKNYNISILENIFKDEIKAKKIVEKIYKGFDISIDMPIVRNVLTVLKKANILNYPAVKQGFINSNLYF
ncbi:MAG: ferritin-like domain-containing protein [Neisseriaceae bacterium]|jgi:hypothetical protein